MAVFVRSSLALFFMVLSAVMAHAQVFGDVLYSWDFSTGLPSGWTNTSASNIGLWEYRGPNTTPSNAVGSRGTCAGAGAPIASLTQANGFMIFDSNYWDDNVPGCGGLGSGVDPAPHTAWLTTNALDFTGVNSVFITFQEQFRLFSANCKVQVSVNNGAWTDAGTNSGLVSANPQWTTYNLTSFAANQSNVRVRFQFQGTYYQWQIDDVNFYTPNANDLLISSTAYTVNPTPDNLYNELEYDKYPSTMLAPLNFRGTIRNIGSNNQTGVTLQATVINQASTVVHTSSSIPTNLVSGQTSSFQTTVTYTPPSTTQNYNVQISANMTPVDENPANNSTLSDFSVTPYTYGRDEGPTENFFIPPAQYLNDRMEIGNVFEGRNSNRKCTSLQVAIGEGTTVGSQIQAVVYNEEMTEIRAVSNPYTINLADINQIGQEKIVTLQLTTPVTMWADTFFVAMVKSLDTNAPFRICRSGQSPTSTSFVNFYDSNALFFIGGTPIVRMNIFVNTQNPGCTDPTAMNFNSTANINDGSCRYPGCTITYAINYNPAANFFDDSCIVPGCTDPSAFNFDPLANVDDGTCVTGGCTNPDATNFDPSAEVDDGSCIVPGCTNPQATNFNPEATIDNGTCVVPGCTNPAAANYNPAATFDDGSCIIAGCTNPDAVNFNPNATLDNGTCIIEGCLDPTASNYDPLANQSDNSCIYLGCTNPDAANYNPQANQDDGSCIITGCTDQNAINYNPDANQDDGSCQIEGCTDAVADNYNPNANIENGSCIYIGCTDPDASNFDPTALEDDGTCIYPGCNDESAINFDPQANQNDGSCIYNSPVFSISATQGCSPLSITITNQTAVNQETICEFFLNDVLVHSGCEPTFDITIEEGGDYQIEYVVTQGESTQSSLSSPIVVTQTPESPILVYNSDLNEIACSNCTTGLVEWRVDNILLPFTTTTISTLNGNVVDNGFYELSLNNENCTSPSETLLVLEPSIQLNVTDQCAPAVIEIINNTDIPQGAVMIVNYGIGNSVVLEAGSSFFNYTNEGNYNLEIDLSFNSNVSEWNQNVVISDAIDPQLDWLPEQDLVVCTNCETNGTTTWTVDGVESGEGSTISDDLGNIYSASLTNSFGCVGTAAIVISNIQEMNAAEWTIYPNPSSGIFRVSSTYPIERLEMINAIGQKVIEQTSLNLTETTVQWDVQGTYLLRMYTGGQWIESRVLIVR
ncbi:MAG: T9SS type A sorting domain-containing protein [Flavobacteriales bacterium]|jgi:hypothetical protein